MTVPSTALVASPAAERIPASAMKATMKATVASGKPSTGASAAYATISAMPPSSLAVEIGSGPSPVAAPGCARRHSSAALARHPSASPSSASRGQKPGPRPPSRARSLSERVAGQSAAASTTPESGAATRQARMLLAQPELFYQMVERGHLAGHPLRERLRPLVGIGGEVPFL